MMSRGNVPCGCGRIRHRRGGIRHRRAEGAGRRAGCRQHQARKLSGEEPADLGSRVPQSQQLTPGSAPALNDVVTNGEAELARRDEVQRDSSPGYSRPDSP